ncbi:4160_t:CDS:2, partial [Funneliformis caledonium]
TSPDENFTSLSKLNNHIASFTANLENGDLLNSTQGITQHQATAAYKLLQNVSLLLEKQQEPNCSKNNSFNGT